MAMDSFKEVTKEKALDEFNNKILDILMALTLPLSLSLMMMMNKLRRVVRVVKKPMLIILLVMCRIL